MHIGRACRYAAFVSAALCSLCSLCSLGSPLPLRAQSSPAAAIPLPEHPRPDWVREHWQNLNGSWQFQFDKQNTGETQGWHRTRLPSPQQIVVPFSWAAPLAQVTDSADIGWYSREIQVPTEWRGERVFLVVGAADWHTTAWLDGAPLGSHQGGYTPFEMELTPHLRPGQAQRLVIRVDDAPRAFRLDGKQGYGNARGIWQTPYLEARGSAPLRAIHFTPDVDRDRVRVTARLLGRATEDQTLTLRFTNAAIPTVTRRIPRGRVELAFDVPIADAHLWSLDDPFLYEVEAHLTGGSTPDAVRSYFGMRKISVMNLPGTDIPYIALNDQPVYLQLALDQAYHPEGFYTFPTDEFTRDEIVRAKRIGLNGLREHVKIETPRKLYWADRLGMLIMSDVPNSWGEPDAEMRQDVEHALRGMIARDYNHPSIFSWIPFNETWGLVTKLNGRDQYLPATQDWVASVYRLTKQLDSTRLVEDNSVCCNRGHTDTDINSWHAYLPGWEWESHLRTISDSTGPGSGWNFEEGYRQGREPMINSEFGNVWGYEGSTGDVDWSWDYHLAVNAFRRHPKLAGWLYTEHHDVINEWNGYWRFDRSEKVTGLEELVEGMSLQDLHSPLYLSLGEELSQAVRPGQQVQVPVYASFLTGTRAFGERLTLRTELYGWDALGRKETYSRSSRAVPYRPWMTGDLEPLAVTMPNEGSVAVLAVRLEDATGRVLHRNFTTFVVEAEAAQEVQLDDGRRARLVQIDPARFDSASWSQKQWNVLDGLKVNGAGSGFFEYAVPWPQGLAPNQVESVSLVAEVSSKQLFGKDRENAAQMGGDYMRGRGTFDPSRNPNAYPMTDETLFPSAVTVRVNGVVAGTQNLRDDPADHRGILSWHSQLRDRKLREAGSYGELLQVAVPPEALAKAAITGRLVVRLEVDPALPGGLAIYGRRFGRYPLDPTLVFVRR
ncbi:MAG: glycoside hydrolase family 2 [Gemmatimonadetes bacterium]|nr:glycoside hydrolase family 2 [Gemmatimonadota bacterium]